MVTVNIGEAKDRFSELIRMVEDGEQVVVARNGTPIVEIVPKRRPERIPGRLKGKFVVPDDIDEPLDAALLALFYGGPIFPPEVDQE